MFFSDMNSLILIKLKVTLFFTLLSNLQSLSVTYLSMFLTSFLRWKTIPLPCWALCLGRSATVSSTHGEIFVCEYDYECGCDYTVYHKHLS